MKRLLIATTALTLLVAPMSEAFAQGWNNNRHDDRPATTTMQRQDDHRPGNDMTMQRHDDNRQADYRNDNYRNDNGGHRDWHKGGRIERNDWNRGQRVNDYRRYHLQRPPRGYEWRRVDNNYVLAAAATGLIMSLVLANH
jgi:Ni/Co efflux regulator RcnB